MSLKGLVFCSCKLYWFTGFTRLPKSSKYSISVFPENASVPWMTTNENIDQLSIPKTRGRIIWQSTCDRLVAIVEPFSLPKKSWMFGAEFVWLLWDPSEIHTNPVPKIREFEFCFASEIGQLFVIVICLDPRCLDMLYKVFKIFDAASLISRSKSPKGLSNIDKKN